MVDVQGRERTSLTIKSKDVANRFRRERDERNLTTTGMLRRLLDQYESPE